MEWYEKLKQFLGLTSQPHEPDQRFYRRSSEPPPNPNDYRRPFDGPPRFSQDPFDMQNFFEQQINTMLHSFGFGDLGNSFVQFGFPQIEEFHHSNQQLEEQPSSSTNLRDQFLKPGHERGAHRPPQNPPQSEVVNNRLDIGSWDSVFRGERSPQTHFYGQSVTSKTIVNPDGSMETHRTVRDHEGNEETTITRRIGDKEHSIIKKKDKEGKEEIIENLVNLDEKEITKYFPSQKDKPKGSWPFYDRFFK